MSVFNSQYAFSVRDRLCRYVQIDTQSDPASTSFPSTEKQKDLSLLLAEELQALGIKNAHMDAHGYVYATVEANSSKPRPVICFCSHVDTTPDCSGKDVKPIVHEDYNGDPIVLPDDASQMLSVEKYPYLAEKKGDDIITASGHTLLGGDDKAGVSIIMDMVQYLQEHPDVEHGVIKILFTPDEEVGRGTEKVDIKKLGADFGFTLDGGAPGDLEDETFSADGMSLIVHGVSAHPGYAKGKLVNALKIAGEILASLPKENWSPETTEKREGFVHPVGFGGNAEKVTVDFIIRSFETPELAIFENRLEALAEEVVATFPGARLECIVKEQYRNMNEVLRENTQIAELAKKAIEAAGLKVTKVPIRGGTDGSRLSFMGLPCPNLFTGMQGIHSKTEWISVQDMQKSVEVLVHLVEMA
jgi:tripeptide aminopeptidase